MYHVTEVRVWQLGEYQMSHEDTRSRQKKSGIYDWTQFEGPMEAIIETSAELADTEPTALEPLQEFVDIDSLQTLLTGQKEVEIVFEYDQILVTIDSEGTLAVSTSKQRAD